MEEIKPTIRVDVGESEQTVKGLKKEISELKDRILNLTKGSDDYNNAVKQLQDDQRKLNEVMALTKKDAVAVKGSYDALTHQMALLKKEWRATADDARRAELGKEINKINQQLKDMDATTGNYQRNVGNYVSHWAGAPDVFAALKQEIKDTKNVLLQLEEGTKEYNDALTRLGNAQFQLKDITEQSKYATTDLGEQLTNVTGIAGGLMAGFSALQGVMALLGKDGENLQKTMVKLQAGMAVVQGLQGLEGLTDKIKGLSVAFKAATGISAGWIAAVAVLITSTTALIKNLPIVKQREEEWANQTEKTKRIQTDLSESIEKGNEKLNDRVELLKAQGVAEKDTLATQTAFAKADKDIAEKNYRETLAAEKRMLEMTETMTAGAFKQVYGRSKKEAKEFYAERTKEAKETYDKALGLYEGYLHKTDVLNEEEKTRFRERLKQYEEALKSEETKLKEQYERDLAEAEKYGYDKTVIEQKYQSDLKAIRDKYKSDSSGATNTETATAIKSANEKIKAAEKATDRKLELLDVEKQKQIEQAYSTITDEKALQAELEKIERESAGKEYEIEQELLNKKLELLNGLLSANTTTAAEKVDIAEAVADLEIEIEKSKQDRLTEIAKQGYKDRSENTKTQPISANTTDTKDIESGLGLIDDFKQQVKTFNDEWGNMNFTQKAAEIGNIVTTSIDGASQIFSQLADMYDNEEELSAEEIKKVKNLRIAGATMDMLSGIIGAISSTAGMGPVGWAMGAIQAGAIATTGHLNIENIKKTDVTGGSSNGSQASVIPNPSSYSSDLPFSYTKQVTGASEVDAINQDQRVYILESDIQESNRRVSVRESESSF